MRSHRVVGSRRWGHPHRRAEASLRWNRQFVAPLEHVVELPRAQGVNRAEGGHAGPMRLAAVAVQDEAHMPGAGSAEHLLEQLSLVQGVNRTAGLAEHIGPKAARQPRQAIMPVLEHLAGWVLGRQMGRHRFGSAPEDGFY